MPYYSDLAKEYQGMATDIQNRLDAQTPPMSLTQYTALEKQRDGLLDQGTDMLAADLQQTLNNLQIDTAKLKDTTDQLKAAIKTTQKVDKLIAVATAALTLATGIVTANPGTIASGIGGAVKALATKDTLPGAADNGGLSFAASANSDDDSSNS